MDGTAKRLDVKNMAQNRYPPWRVIKDGTTFNKMIQDVADVVIKTKGSINADEYESRKAQFEGVSYSLKQVGRMRYIDHSYYLIERLKHDIPGIDIKKSRETGVTQFVKDVGIVDSYEFLRQETIDANKEAIPDIEDKMKASYDDFYSTDTNAKEHKIVMDSFEISLNRLESTSCSI